jgi:hypothetical protein
MTEAEWLACADPKKMLDCLRGKASERKLRLFACACCRRIWHLWEDEPCRKVIEILEDFVDGKANEEALAAAGAAVKAEGRTARYGLASLSVWKKTWAVSTNEGWEAARSGAWGEHQEAARAEAWAGILKECEVVSEKQCNSLRCIFGDPFRPVVPDPNWRTWNDNTLPQLAERIYLDRAFDHLPILADALEKTGCADQDILNHCREPGPHVRGCWVVDLVLGKT